MINWQRAILAGVIAGIVFVMMEMLLITLAMVNPRGDLRA